MDSDLEEFRKGFVQRFLSIFSNNAPYSTPIQLMSLAYRGNILDYSLFKNSRDKKDKISMLETKAEDA